MLTTCRLQGIGPHTYLVDVPQRVDDHPASAVAALPPRPGNGVYAIDEDRDGAIDYQVGNPDFDVRDFNSNLVLWWEYSPGSTAYLV